MRYASILNSDLSSLAETVYTYKPKRRKSLDESYSAVSSGPVPCSETSHFSLMAQHYTLRNFSEIINILKF